MGVLFYCNIFYDPKEKQNGGTEGNKEQQRTHDGSKTEKTRTYMKHSRTTTHQFHANKHV